MSTVEEAISKLKETAKPEQPVEQATEQPTEAEQTELPESQDLETQEDNQEIEAEEAEQKTDEIEADDGAERIELEADQFAELLSIKSDLLDINEEGKVRFKAKEGSKTVDVTLEQLINAYQGDANLTNRSKELAEMKKQRETELINLQNTNKQFAQQTATMLEGLKEQYLKPYDDINWKELKAEDPGEYAAQMQDKRATEERLAGIASKALEQINQAQETQNKELQKQYSEYLNAQADIVREKIPNFDKAQSEITSYMQQVGFNDTEISQAADSRIIEAIYKAMLFDKGKKGAKEKLSKPLPRVLKPGKSLSKQDVSMEKNSQLRSKLKETGDWRDAVALLKQRS